MSLSIADLRSSLRKHIFGRDDPDEMANAEVDGFLNRSYWEVYDKFPFRELESSTTFSTADGTADYSLPTVASNFSSVRSVSLSGSSLSAGAYPLDRMTLSKYNSLFDYNTKGVPTHYVRDASFIRLYPTPDGVYTVHLDFLKQLTDLGDSSDPVIPDSWHEIILLGAVWRYYMMNKNYTEMNQVRQVQAGLINTSVPVEAKEERDSRNAGLTVIRNSWGRRLY